MFEVIILIKTILNVILITMLVHIVMMFFKEVINDIQLYVKCAAIHLFGSLLN